MSKDDALWVEVCDTISRSIVDITNKPKSNGFKTTLRCTRAAKFIPEDKIHELSDCYTPYGFMKVWSIKYNEWRSVQKGSIDSFCEYEGARF
jgi:hypothetical protein